MTDALINLSLIFNGFVTFLLIFFTLGRNNRSLINRTFAFFLFNAAVWPFSTYFFRTAASVEVAFFWISLIYIAGIIVPSVFVFFAYVFAGKKLTSLKIILFFIFPILLLSVLLFIKNLWIKTIFIDNTGNSVSLGFAYLVWFLYYGIYLIWGTWVFYTKYQDAKGLLRVQIRYIFVAIAFPIVGAVLPNIILPYLGNFRLIFIGPFFLTLMNVIIAYAILKHTLLDIRLVVARSVAYTLLISALGGLYAGGLFLVSSVLFKDAQTAESLITSTFLALVIALTFQPLRRFFEGLTAGILFKNTYNRDDFLSEMSKITASTLDISDLAESVLNKITNDMNIEQASFFILNKKGRILSSFQSSTKNYLFLKETQIRKLSQKGKTIVQVELDEGKRKKTLRERGISVFLPLFAKDDMVGVLLLSEKSSGEIYYGRDLKTLQILAPEIAIAFQNAQNYHEIQEFTKTLEKKVEERTKQLKETQKRELDRAKELLRLKNEFVYIVSHDLRNPITVINGYVNLIREANKDLPSNFTDNFKQIELANKRLNSLVDDLLEVAKSESQVIKIKVEPTEIAPIIEETVTQFTPLAKENSVKITTKLEPNLNKVLVNKEKFAEICENLVSNAIKYNQPGGEVKIAVKRRANSAIISVKDSGIGIPKKLQKKVFTEFFRIKGEGKQTEGTGLGLFIVKMLVDKMGGRIKFKSKENEGTTFTLSFPFV